MYEEMSMSAENYKISEYSFTWEYSQYRKLITFSIFRNENFLNVKIHHLHHHQNSVENILNPKNLKIFSSFKIENIINVKIHRHHFKSITQNMLKNILNTQLSVVGICGVKSYVAWNLD